MSSFRAERDTRYDFYFSVDILDALTELDEMYPASTSNDQHAHLQRQGIELAIGKLAQMFGFTFSPTGSERPSATAT
jgi:hypothetical protein